MPSRRSMLLCLCESPRLPQLCFSVLMERQVGVYDIQRLGNGRSHVGGLLWLPDLWRRDSGHQGDPVPLSRLEAIWHLVHTQVRLARQVCRNTLCTISLGAVLPALVWRCSPITYIIVSIPKRCQQQHANLFAKGLSDLIDRPGSHLTAFLGFLGPFRRQLRLRPALLLMQPPHTRQSFY